MTTTPPPDDWQHLTPYGYAPGGYMSRCRDCGETPIMDKRAWRCRHCAEKMHAAQGSSDPIVGHKTFSDGTGGYRHEPLRRSEADAVIAAAEAAQAKRAADMPTEEDAARAMWSAWQRLRELGWRETMYGPTNERVRTISPGSSGIHIGSRHDPWPEKTWWIEDGGDLWPGNPALFKPIA